MSLCCDHKGDIFLLASAPNYLSLCRNTASSFGLVLEVSSEALFNKIPASEGSVFNLYRECVVPCSNC